MSSAPTGVLCLMGPTAVGKTDIAISLARALPLEIVSVDSAMVYRGLDVGAGKPTAHELLLAPHHLIDIRDPRDAYSAAEFAADARELIAAIHRRGCWPLLVGGTGLYFRAFLDGLSPLPPANAGLRRRLEEETRRHGLAAMHRRLAAVDRVAARRIHITDPQRIQRALEVYELTGSPLSELQRGAARGACPWPVMSAAIVPHRRDWLHQRIEQRFERMLERGLLAEVRALAALPAIHRDLPALRAVGYRQVLGYIDGEYGAECMAERAVIATRQLARRQLTWLRRQVVDEHIVAGPEVPVETALSFARSALATFGEFNENTPAC